MDKPSFLALLLLASLALILFYEPLYDPALSASSVIEILGMSAFLLVCVSLIIGPLATLRPKVGLPLIAARRSVGLAAFVFALAHVLLALDLYLGWNVASALSFPPLLLGLIAFILITVLALTSSDWATQRLGARTWKMVQSANYLVFILSLTHFILNSRALPFLSSSGRAHLLEGLLLLLGIATLLLQVAGFLTRRSRVKPAPASSVPKDPSAIAGVSTRPASIRPSSATPDLPSAPAVSVVSTEPPRV